MQPDILFKTFQDVSRWDNSRKDKDFSRNVQELNNILILFKMFHIFQEFLRL